ncbi:MAG TPA: response regulator transcription factor [Bacteroidia bacterium]|jgi:DNA-binding NarL/FixJ family response regulator|nr:response regulator transcription factor [Bacteroidia bacterium]
MKDKIKIHLVDDQQLFRQGVRSLLKGFNNLEVTGEAGNGIELLESLKESEPDVILLDIKMPLMNGEEAAKEIKKNFPGIKIIILTMHDEAYYILELIKIGIDGFLPKNCDIKEIVIAIESVNAGKIYFEENIARALETCEEFVRPENCVLGQKALDEMEKNVLKAICAGKRDKEIADHLNMSVYTVDFHKRNIKEKTGLQTSAELALYAVKNGIIPFN